MKETPSQLPIPAFVMNFPFTLDTSNPNNIWMKEMEAKDLKINKGNAYRQFLDLYQFIAGNSLVNILPTYGEYQDLVYVANMGIYLPHIKDSNNIILSNFTSEPRQGEEKVGKPFFDLMGYQTHMCPFKWEGEADLKYLYDNVYIGGYGQRSDIQAFEWMEKEFDMNIIKIEMVDEYLYHLDCSIFPLTKEKTLICTELYTPKELAHISQYTNIIDISVDDTYNGIANSARLGNMILCASNISELTRADENYEAEKHKINSLEKICFNEGLEPVFFNISEFMKSGAMLSCMLMHLNYVDLNKSLV
jgi:N-dimethylarginine dimethylaminohydrolase|tara:strand:- start:1091 stop:2005 length:915 start_codon:yes stop_codon:yes gene_type:complete